MAIMTVERWLKYTNAGRTAIRSNRLKAVDIALTEFHGSPIDDHKDRLRSALVAWLQELGPGWKTNERNRYQAIDDLYRQVMDIGTPKTGAEMVALSHLQDESRALVDMLFREKTLDWRTGFVGKLGDRKYEAVFTISNEAVGAAAGVDELVRGDEAFGPTSQRAVTAGAKAVAPVAKTVAWALTLREQLLLQLVPADIRHQVLMALTQVFPDFMERLVASMIPFAGIITSSAVLAKDLRKVVLETYHLDRTRMHVERSLAVADPAAAMRAVIRILERERNADAAEALLSIAEFGGKLAGALIDGGAASSAAIGAASGVVKLMNIIRVIVRDVKEKNAANLAMARGVDLTIFGICPLAGAYYVCCAPTSALVNDIYTRWWQPGWRGDVERTVVRHLDPIRDRARRVISDHRFVIKGLERYPGVLARNDKELEAMMQRMGKTGMEGFGYHNMPPVLNAKQIIRRR